MSRLMTTLSEVDTDKIKILPIASGTDMSLA